MKLIYIAAPYRSSTILGQQKNIQDASLMAQYYWLRGFAVICPHLNSANFDGLILDKFFLAGTKLMLSKCNAIAMHPHFRLSSGCCEEFIFAHENNIEVYQHQPMDLDIMRDKITHALEKSSD